MLRRFFNIVVAVLTLGLVRLEKKTAVARRTAAVDQKARTVAKARSSLGTLGGHARIQAQEVQRLEEELRAATSRKTYFLKQVQSAAPDSPEVAEAKDQARRYHLQVTQITGTLNVARTELQNITREYEQAKALVLSAQSDVQDARKQGQRLERRLETAERRHDLVEATASLRGLGGLGDELSAIDQQLNDQVAQLEGATLVAADLAAAETAERQLDIKIAHAQADEDFERELLALESQVADAPALDIPALPTGEVRETVPAKPRSRKAH